MVAVNRAFLWRAARRISQKAVAFSTQLERGNSSLSNEYVRRERDDREEDNEAGGNDGDEEAEGNDRNKEADEDDGDGKAEGDDGDGKAEGDDGDGKADGDDGEDGEAVGDDGDEDDGVADTRGVKRRGALGDGEDAEDSFDLGRVCEEVVRPGGKYFLRSKSTALS